MSELTDQQLDRIIDLRRTARGLQHCAESVATVAETLPVADDRTQLLQACTLFCYVLATNHFDEAAALEATAPQCAPLSTFN